MRWLRWFPKMNVSRLFFVIAAFSLGYLLGYLTLFWTSPYVTRHLTLDNSWNDSDRKISNHNVFERSVNAPLAATEGADKYSYLLVLYYFEQMNNALRNLLHLGPVAMNLNLKVVEPFVVHSRLYGLPDMLPAKEVAGIFYSLRTLFNIDTINQSLYSYARASMVSFQDFIFHAPRDIVVVYFIHKENARPRTFRLAYRYLRLLKLVSEAEKPIIDCTDEVFREEQLYGGLMATLLNITSKYGAVNFRIAKFICVAGERDTTTDQLNEALGLERKTVIFPEWRGCCYKHCNMEMRHKYITHSRPKLLYRMEGEKETPLNLSYVSSDLVTETANYLIKGLNLTKTSFTAVYLRIEKLLKKNGTLFISKDYQDCCVSVLQKVLNNVKKRYKLTDVILITDMGKYGSDSCTTGECKVESESLLRRIEAAIKVEMFDYEPSKTPLKIDNGGFAALVEMEMLARARRLITVGSGVFKEQVSQLFETRNTHAKVYAVCKEWNVNVLNEFSSVASSRC